MTVFSGKRRSRTRLVSCDERKTETGMGRKASPGAQRRVALDVLEELGHEVEEAVEAGVEQGPAALAELRVRWVSRRRGRIGSSTRRS